VFPEFTRRDGNSIKTFQVREKTLKNIDIYLIIHENYHDVIPVAPPATLDKTEKFPVAVTILLLFHFELQKHFDRYD